MKLLVTGSAGHLGAGLVLTLRRQGHDVVALDRLDVAPTTHVGSITDADFVADAMRGVEAVFHPATLHKPHLATHSRRTFIDVNVGGTEVLLDAAAAVGVSAFVFTSTTSTFGHALRPAAAGDPAVWVDESLRERPKNIYGVTKVAAEGLCSLFHQRTGIPCLVLRTSRFFPEPDDSAARRATYANEHDGRRVDGDANLKANEYLNRRVELEDAVEAHLCALRSAEERGFGTYIVSATPPFAPEHCAELGRDAPPLIRRRFPEVAAEYARRGWRLPPTLDRVYDNAKARRELGWRPRVDFGAVLAALAADDDPRSALAREVGARGYPSGRLFDGDGPYPVEPA